MIAAVDTSPIIALSAVGELAVLDQLFDELLVPVQVRAELRLKPPAPELVALRALHGLVFVALRRPPQPETAVLHRGERAVISLAVRRQAVALLDDGPERKIAARMGLKVIGTLGVLLEARRRGHIDRLAPKLHTLRARGFRLSDVHIAAALQAAGEG